VSTSLVPTKGGPVATVMPAVRSALANVKPTVLDRVIGYVAPQMALRRLGARVRMEAALRLFGGGSYKGARHDTPNTKEWHPQLDGPNSSTLPDLDTLRADCADLERNAPIATGVVNTNVTSTVGTGLLPYARVDREFLKLSDEQADQWESDAERIFDWWASSQGRPCDLARRLDFYSMQGLALRSALGRGDIFAIRRQVDRPGDLLSTRVQLIEADRVSNPNFALDTTRFMGGIEFDENGVAMRCHVRSMHPGEIFGFLAKDAFTWVPEPFYGAETKQLRVLHVMDVLRVGQVRGVPYLAPVIEALKGLDRYSEAELTAAVLQSFFTVFIKTETGDDGFSDEGEESTVDASRATDTTARDVRLGIGKVVALAQNEDITMADPKRPNSAFDPFVQAILRQVGVALEVPYELLIKHFASSYSASRAAIIEAWRSTMRRRDWLSRSFCQPCWEWVIEEAIARGLLSAPGFLENPLVRQAYCRAEWIGPAMGALDPESEVNAAESRVRLGISTLQAETAALTGRDWREVERQRAKEQKMRVHDGLDVDITPTETVRETVNDPSKPGQQPQGGVPQRESQAAQQRREESQAEGRAIRQLSESVHALASRPPAPVHVNVAVPPAQVSVTVPASARPTRARRAADGALELEYAAAGEER
jgi:lambda family phage portal protein